MKRLREGFTTGSCAAAAALASCLWQSDGECPEQVELVVPEGRVFRAAIIAHEFPRCGVVKDAGDDPDITNGLEVCAQVSVQEQEGPVRFLGGEGVGCVTQPGLKCAPGEPAINPVPRRMIEDAVRRVFPAREAMVTVSIPGGAPIAHKTFNPRLGIEGGLSVLGTTGVVRPMSEDALMETTALEMRVKYAQGIRCLALTFGNQGETALSVRFPALRGQIVQMSNFVGFALDTAHELGFERLLIAGHPGKLVKVAAGVMQTHNKIADARRETVMAHLALLGAQQALIEAVYRAATTDAMAELIAQAGLSAVWNTLADAARGYCLSRVHGGLSIDVMMMNTDGSVLGVSADVERDDLTWPMA